MIFSLFFGGGVYSRGAFILKSEILGGAFIRGNTVFSYDKCFIIYWTNATSRSYSSIIFEHS